MDEGQIWLPVEPGDWHLFDDTFAILCPCGRHIVTDAHGETGCPSCGRVYRILVSVQSTQAQRAQRVMLADA